MELIILNLLIVGIGIMVGLFANFIFKKTRIPDVLILLLFGALISYLGLVDNIKNDASSITFLITISLIYVVFYGALPIRLKALFSTSKYAFLSSIINFILITGLVGVIAYFLGFGWIMGLSLGALFCVLDGSIINSLLETIKLGEKAEAQVQTESAIIDILVVVGILSLINFANLTIDQVFKNLASYLFLSFGIGIAAAMIWAFVLKQLGESTPLATMGVLVIVFAIGEFVGANGVITIFSFSIMLGNVYLWRNLMYKEQKTNFLELNLNAKNFFKDISFLIRIFLFIYLGILIDFSKWTYLLIGLGFFIIAYVVRSLINHFVNNHDLKEKEYYFLDSMCAKGLTPTVMLIVIKADAAFTNIVVGGIFFSVLITSILLPLIENDKYTSVSCLLFRNCDLSKKKTADAKKEKINNSKKDKDEDKNDKVEDKKSKAEDKKDKTGE